MSMARGRGLSAAISYVLTVVAANWAIDRYGVVPVGLGLAAPAGVCTSSASPWCSAITSVERGMVMYLDPPYLGTTRSGRNYLTEMSSAAEHRELAAALNAARATVLLSGYHSALYDDLYAGWHRTEFQATTNGDASGNRGIRTEVLWSNQPLGESHLFSEVAG